MKVLVVKMSSLGDVVHTLPAVTDAVAAGHEIHWVVEEAFAPIAAAHPGVTKVIPIAWRRWRKSLLGSRHELAAFRRELMATDYDLVIDAQGLYKSSVVARMAKATHRAGYDKASARESGAAWGYDQHYAVGVGQHAIDRTRQLLARALGYGSGENLPAELNFGLAPQRQSPSAAPHRFTCLFLHGTTWASKHWPETYWVQLANRAMAAGAQILLPWGSEVERARAERIIESAGTTSQPTGGTISLLPRLSLAELIPRLASSDLVIGVDSGLTHLAAAYGLPTVALYGSTVAALTGVRGPEAQSLQADFPCAPCRNRECSYQGDSEITPACYTNIPPDRVWALALQQYAGASRLLPL